MTCTCKLCRKETRRRHGPGRDENSRPGDARTNDLAPSDTGISGQLSTAPSNTMSGHRSPHLYELDGLRGLRCTLCDFKIAPGLAQRRDRIAHANIHITEGRVVAVRSGLDDGAVYFE